MTAAPVRPIAAADLDAVTDVLVRAFDDDPWMNFIATQDARRVQRLRRWLRRGLDQSFPLGACFRTDDGAGIALWVPPRPPRVRGWRDELRMWWMLFRTCGLRRMRTVRAGMRLVGAHAHEERHIGLRYLAVEPSAQGRGLAAALLRDGLARADAEGLPVGLHCTKERNVALYEHFGFRVLAVIAIPGGPRMWDMWRDARHLGEAADAPRPSAPLPLS